MMRNLVWANVRVQPCIEVELREGGLEIYIGVACDGVFEQGGQGLYADQPLAFTEENEEENKEENEDAGLSTEDN